jgi:hypothetical protein
VSWQQLAVSAPGKRDSASRNEMVDGHRVDAGSERFSVSLLTNASPTPRSTRPFKAKLSSVRIAYSGVMPAERRCEVVEVIPLPADVELPIGNAARASG